MSDPAELSPPEVPQVQEEAPETPGEPDFSESSFQWQPLRGRLFKAVIWAILTFTALAVIALVLLTLFP